MQASENVIKCQTGLYLPLWLLDGAGIRDRSAYGHLATVTGALWTPQGRRFDGIDDFINCGNSTLLAPGAGDMTWECWVKPASFVAEASPFKRWVSSGTNRYELRHYETSFEFNVMDENGVNFDGIWNYTSVAGKWYHLTLVLARPNCILYINGSAQATKDASAIGTVAGTANFEIGSNQAGYRYAGTIGEFLIYNRGLTAGEVMRNDQAAKWRYN